MVAKKQVAIWIRLTVYDSIIDFKTYKTNWGFDKHLSVP